MARNVLCVDWKAFNGATVKRRMLRLTSNADGIYLCPLESCLHVGFKSQRGLRKHIDSRHSWYYYFDAQPEFRREDVIRQGKVKVKQTTHKMPAFCLDEGVGKYFLIWLGTPCGGGKTAKEAKQIARRAMKFLMASLGDTEVETFVKEEYVDCCLGSPSVVITFIKTITEGWGLTSSGALNYLKAMCDLLDFRKASGVTDAVLRTFTVTEVYLRRGKENLAKKKKVEYSRNLDLESLIARDSWATISDMEKVIPYHIGRYKDVTQKSSCKDTRPTRSELAFATRFIATFLFLRVKCSRPMTYQYITLHMIDKAKLNGGYIDQTEFKTSDKFLFDTVILSDDVLQILDSYITTIRPLLNPACDYLLVSTVGRQYQSFTTAMTLLVKEAIGKYIHPTRYRQIVETVSGEMLDTREQGIISRDQKHSSYVAKRYYQKTQSRDIATQGKQCMEKIVGSSRTTSTQELANIVADIDRNSLAFDQSVVDQARDILQPTAQLMETVNRCTDNDISLLQDLDVVVTGSTEGKEESDKEDVDLNVPFTREHAGTDAISGDVEVKREEAEKQLPWVGKSKRFTAEEDHYLKLGIAKYGKGSWSHILHDSSYKFHPTRSRDSLRMRAETCAFKIRKNVTN